MQQGYYLLSSLNLDFAKHMELWYALVPSLLLLRLVSIQLLSPARIGVLQRHQIYLN